MGGEGGKEGDRREGGREEGEREGREGGMTVIHIILMAAQYLYKMTSRIT